MFLLIGEFNRVLCEPRGVGGRYRRERPYVDLWLIHIVVWIKPAQHCKAITLQKLLFKYIQTHDMILYIFVVQSLCPVLLSATPWTAAHQASLSFTISRSLLKFMSIGSVMPSNHLISCHPLLLLPSIFQHQGLSNDSVLHIRWLNYWSFSFSIKPSNQYSGLISFRTDWFDLLAVQGTLKSLFQHHLYILRRYICYMSIISQ